MKRYVDFMLEEVGIRNLKSVIKGHNKCEIYFHKDLDGVCTALCVKEFFYKYYDIEMVDCHIIQYGSLEFAVKNKKPETLAIICDFAHSKPMFTIAFDHHDRQAGAESTSSTYYKPSRSNAETISGEISYSDLFTPGDIDLIKTVDSADFLRHGLKPEDIQNSIFKISKNLSGEKNRFMMGLVVNRLLLAYKNKRISVNSLSGEKTHINRNILECMVMDCTTSLYSMFNNLRHYISHAKTRDKLGVLASPEDLMANVGAYIDRMKSYRFVEPKEGEVAEYDPEDWRHRSAVSGGSKVGKGVHFDAKYGIISQYGGGNMFKPGSYDRYVPFKNNPEANFICIVWPMGLIQVSCNPFKEKKLKNIDLGEIAKEVIAPHKEILEKILIPIDTIKKEYETSQDWEKMEKEEGSDYDGVGFRFSDLMAFYKDCILQKTDSGFVPCDVSGNKEVESKMNMVYPKMSQSDNLLLSNYRIPAWEIILRSSGGHKSITNIQGFNFLKYNKRGIEIAYKTDKYTDIMKKIAREFINLLQSKIDIDLSGDKVGYSHTEIEFSGNDANE